MRKPIRELSTFCAVSFSCCPMEDGAAFSFSCTITQGGQAAAEAEPSDAATKKAAQAEAEQRLQVAQVSSSAHCCRVLRKVFNSSAPSQPHEAPYRRLGLLRVSNVMSCNVTSYNGLLSAVI